MPVVTTGTWRFREWCVCDLRIGERRTRFPWRSAFVWQRSSEQQIAVAENHLTVCLSGETNASDFPMSGVIVLNCPLGHWGILITWPNVTGTTLCVGLLPGLRFLKLDVQWESLAIMTFGEICESRRALFDENGGTTHSGVWNIAPGRECTDMLMECAVLLGNLASTRKYTEALSY